jgi:hypothetical protein
MNERLWANVLSGLVGLFFGTTIAAMAQNNGTFAGFSFLLLILLSARRWHYWHMEGE